MSLRDRANQLDRPHQGTVCWYKIIVLSDEDRAFLNEMMADLTISAAHISRILKADNYQVNAHAIRSHRNKECRCWG